MPETYGDITSHKTPPLVHIPSQVNKDTTETLSVCVGSSGEKQTSGSHYGYESNDVAWKVCTSKQRAACVEGRVEEVGTSSNMTQNQGEIISDECNYFGSSSDQYEELKCS